MNNPESRKLSPSFNYPELDSLKKFTHSETVYDKYVKKSVESGFMTEEELLIGRWIKDFINLNLPQAEDDHAEEERRSWRAKLPEACREAAKQFGISAQEAETLFEKSLNIRSNAMGK